jgi:hypothetical protein
VLERVREKVTGSLCRAVLPSDEVSAITNLCVLEGRPRELTIQSFYLACNLVAGLAYLSILKVTL